MTNETTNARLKAEAVGLPEAAQDGAGDFSELVEAHRWDLHAHCYRMLGSLHGADDAVQDTLLRAWRALIVDVTAFRTPTIFPRFELPDRLAGLPHTVRLHRTQHPLPRTRSILKLRTV
jgi:hypothetical protein